MSVRKREWTNPQGAKKTAWVIDYKDSNGHRTHVTFSTKKAAQARHDEVSLSPAAIMASLPVPVPSLSARLQSNGGR